MGKRTWTWGLVAAFAVMLALGGCGGGRDGGPPPGPPPVDTDQDGVADHLDADDDNDGVADVDDPAPLDPDIPEEVDIPDPGLREVLEKRYLDKAPGTPIYAHELAALDSLHAGVNTERIRSLEGLQHATGLGYLNLQYQEVSDLSPLAGLTALQSLTLRRNRITDLSPLAGLVDLEDLYLESNYTLSDVTPLANLTRLKVLFLTDGIITDLSPLAGLTELESLAVGQNRISDLSPLAGLTKLKELRIYDNFVKDLSPLTGMTDLRLLGAIRLPVSDLSPLAGMTKLTHLSLRDLASREGSLTDLSPLAGLTELESLIAERFDISDLSPLAGLTELSELHLDRNRISDLSPLAGLGKLTDLDLAANRISDLSPLVANDGLGEGDIVRVPINPLSAASLDRHAPDLRRRGVDIEFDAFTVGLGDTPLIYNDNVFVLHAPEEGPLDPQAIAREFYRHFEDAFDFLMLFPLYYSLDGRFAYFRGVSNDVQGIGLPLYSDASHYGSEGRLQGVPIFFYLGGWSGGDSVANHELMHQWANYIVPAGSTAHWGFSSAYGPIGGFKIEELVDHGDGLYSAHSFSPGGYRGNTLPYSPMELYLMGLAPPEEVPNLWVAENGRFVRDEDGNPVPSDRGGYLFTGDKTRTYTIEDIIEMHGPRVPAYPNAQSTFRAAAVLVIQSGAPPVGEYFLRLTSESVAWYGHPGDDSQRHYWNFHEATGGRGTLEIDGLSRHNTREPVPVRWGAGGVARPPTGGRRDQSVPWRAALDAPTHLDRLPEAHHDHAHDRAWDAVGGGTP